MTPPHPLYLYPTLYTTDMQPFGDDKINITPSIFVACITKNIFSISSKKLYGFSTTSTPKTVGEPNFINWPTLVAYVDKATDISR